MQRILIVDMDAAIGRMLSIVLQHTDRQVVAVTSAAAALDHLRARRFDVVLSEFCLGGAASGLQLSALVHRHWPSVRFFLGTRADELETGLARRCHIEAVLIKPYHLADVRRVAGPRPASAGAAALTASST